MSNAYPAVQAKPRNEAQSPSTDAHFRRLREHFDDDAIIELTGLIAFQNLSSKFNAALGVEPQGFCTPDRASAPRVA